MKVVSESRVTWATSVPILVFLGLSVLNLGPIYATYRKIRGSGSVVGPSPQTVSRASKNWSRLPFLTQVFHPSCCGACRVVQKWKTVLSERMWHYWKGRHMLWPLLHISGGQDPSNSKESLVNSTAYIHQKKPRLRDRTDRAWFSHHLQHPARKRSRSILTTPEPAWGDRIVAQTYTISHQNSKRLLRKQQVILAENFLLPLVVNI